MMSTLPNFLVVGARRSGTTSLVRYLGEHPQVFVAPQKEVHFFDTHFDRGVAWYESQFADSEGAVAVGEGTPRYMYLESAPARMASVVPDASLVAVLREPVERAYSHYWQNRARGIERRPFADAVAAERSDPAGDRHAYLDRGRYIAQLQRLEQHFPRDQLHVLLFDDLRDRPREAYAAVCRFLGVDDVVPDLVGAALNRYHDVRSVTARRVAARLPSRLGDALHRLNRAQPGYPPLDADLRAELAGVVAEDNAALSRWLGRDLGWTT